MREVEGCRKLDDTQKQIANADIDLRQWVF